MMRAVDIRPAGRRGLFVAALGAGWVVYGVGALVAGRARPWASWAPVDNVMSQPVVGIVWIIAGALALAAGVAARSIPGVEMVGFGAVQAPPLVWAIGYAVSTIGAWSSGIPTRDWASTGVWLAIVGAISVVSGWNECYVPPRPGERGSQ